jgi:hypothetical protein
VCAYRRTPVACDVDRQAWKAGLLSFTDHERPKSPRGPAVFIVRSGRSVDAPSVLPEGFRYHHGLITADEEEALAGELAALPFKPFDFHDYQASRQVVGFGLRYDYDRRAVVEAAPGEPCGQAQRPPADKAGYLKRDAPSAANPPDSGRGGNRPPDRAEIKKLVALNPVAGMPPTLSRHCSLRLQQGRRDGPGCFNHHSASAWSPSFRNSVVAWIRQGSPGGRNVARDLAMPADAPT